MARKVEKSAMKRVTVVAICVLLVSAHQHSPGGVYLQEGFNGGGVPAGWTVNTVSGTTSGWSIVGTGVNPPIAPYAGAGQAKFNSYDASPGHQSRLTSRRTNFTGSTDPFITLFMYHDDEFLEAFDSVYVEATTGDSVSGPWTPLAAYLRPRTTSGWKREFFSLLQYNGAPRVFISFRGVSQFGNNIYIDEVRVADSSFHDIGVAALLSPGSSLETTPGTNSGSSRLHLKKPKANVDAGTYGQMATMLSATTPFNINTVVQNFGTFSEPSYQVRWSIDGQGQPAVNSSRALSRNGRDTVTLSWLTPTPGTHSIAAWTSLGTDSNRTNDSVRLTVTVLDSTVVFAEMFNGGTFPPPGWTAVNRDGGALAPWFQGTSISAFLPFEGTGFAANNFQRANGTYIDDYLISPPIPNIAQSGRTDSLRLWVRSVSNPPPAMNYPDSLMVLLSTTGVDTSNFTIVVDYFEVPKTGWSLKKYALLGRVPQNSTIRVACRYLHYNGGQSGNSSDFIGVDFLHVTRGLPTAVKNPETPSFFALDQNYPNPFNPSTEIGFSVGVTGKATLQVFDVIGQTVATLFDGIANAGQVYRVRLNAVNLAGGVYFYALRSAQRTELRKMVLAK